MPHAENGSGVELAVIRTGDVLTPSGYVYRADGNRLSRLRTGLRAGEDAIVCPCLAFVVTHPSAGVFLVDTGFHPDTRTNLRKDFGVPMSMLFKNLRPASLSFDRQLRELEIAPSSVEMVLMTHLHVDHTSGMRLLPNARFTITDPEWHSAHGGLASTRGYARHHLPPGNRVDLIDLSEEGTTFGPFSNTIDLLGDGTIRLLSTPGHSKGHMSVLLRLKRGPRVVLVGDAAYTLRSIRHGILPMFTDEDNNTRRSLGELRAFIEQSPDAILVPSHDPDAWRALDNIATHATGVSLATANGRVNTSAETSDPLSQEPVDRYNR
jgi:glyoxylase-like metal-dependent hydrolase (beta-lactamase superfamily II)